MENLQKIDTRQKMIVDNNILNLTLKKEWFDMIASGEKTEEYREIKPYWKNRLELNDKDGFIFRQFNQVLFTNGYGNNRPSMLFRVDGICVSCGKGKWGATPSQLYYVIKLGHKIESRNIK